MQVGDYNIIRFDPQYLDEVVELLAPLWGNNLELNKAYFEWKHNQNPYLKEPIIHLALYEGRPVGVRAYSASYWQAGKPEKRYLCVTDADAVVHPDHRRRGLLKNMTSIALNELEDEPFDFVVTLSAAQNSSENNLKLGWEKVGELETMDWRGQDVGVLCRISRKIPFLPVVFRHFRKVSTSHRLSSDISSAFHSLDRNFEQSKRSKMEGIILEKIPRPEEMAILARSQANDGLIRHVRDQEFHAWRFRNPLSEYRFLFSQKDALEGYVVLQRGINNNPNSVCIVDWEATNIKVLEGLFLAVIHWGGFSAISIWSATLSNIVKNILLKHGFFAERDQEPMESDLYFHPILVKPLRADKGLLMGGRNLLDLSNWDLRPIYSDSY